MVLKRVLESGEMKVCDVGVGDEDVGGGRERLEDGLDDVWDEMKATVNGMFAEDGYGVNVGGSHGEW